MENTTEINAAIKVLAEKITKESTPDEALKFSQSALNLAHTLQTFKSTEKFKPPVGAPYWQT